MVSVFDVEEAQVDAREMLRGQSLSQVGPEREREREREREKATERERERERGTGS